MRGQAHTLEAVVAALLMITSVVFALQMTAVTPLSASTSSQHVENQQQANAAGLLASAAENGALKRSLLFWNRTEGAFHNTTERAYYTRRAPSNEFGRMLEENFGRNGIAYNVYLTHYKANGDKERRRMVYRGAPSNNAVTTARTVVLTDDARLYNETGEATVRVNDTNFYAADATPETGVYNVVRVEVVVWRI